MKKYWEERIEKKNRPRIIDIDILSYDDLEINSKILKIPHPRLSERNFVLKPWNDIAPNLILPTYSKTINDLLINSKDNSDIKMLLIINNGNLI